jgi:hypothetical protein
MNVDCLNKTISFQMTMKEALFLGLLVLLMNGSFADDDDIDGCEIIFGPAIGQTLPRGHVQFIDPCVFCECPENAFPGAHASCDRLQCEQLPPNCTKPILLDGDCCYTCESNL